MHKDYLHSRDPKQYKPYDVEDEEKGRKRWKGGELCKDPRFVIRSLRHFEPYQQRDLYSTLEDSEIGLN